MPNHWVRLQMTEDPSIKQAILETRFDGHEKVCGERYGEIKDSFERVHGRLDVILYSVIGLLVTIIGYALVTWAPWVK